MTLDDFNALVPDDAERALLDCCGSTRWAGMMAAARPFATRDDLVGRAETIWWSLGEADWREAFARHPRIGERQAAGAPARPAAWSASEQRRVQSADEDTRSALASANERYERRFGFIFIVCATGRSADEMLAALEARLDNDLATELRVAAGEQVRITRLRLEKLVP